MHISFFPFLSILFFFNIVVLPPHFPFLPFPLHSFIFMNLFSHDSFISECRKSKYKIFPLLLFSLLFTAIFAFINASFIFDAFLVRYGRSAGRSDQTNFSPRSYLAIEVQINPSGAHRAYCAASATPPSALCSNNPLNLSIPFFA